MALYAVCGMADAVLTYQGLAGRLELEGNPFLRAAMHQWGVIPALMLGKTTPAVLFYMLAVDVGVAVHERRAWVAKLPTLPFIRRWMEAGDRCWTALIPLYGAALAQAFAAVAWLGLKFL